MSQTQGGRPRKPLIFDLSQVDLTQSIWDKQRVMQFLPQRREFELVDGIIHLDEVGRNAVAYKDLAADDWWTVGHIPGRPLFPGVLMIEAAAQTCACLTKIVFPNIGFIGFAGVDEVKFRGQVVPPGRFYMLVHGFDMRPRRVIGRCQGLYNDEVVFEAMVTGMPI